MLKMNIGIKFNFSLSSEYSHNTDTNDWHYYMDENNQTPDRRPNSFYVPSENDRHSRFCWTAADLWCRQILTQISFGNWWWVSAVFVLLLKYFGIFHGLYSCCRDRIVNTRGQLQCNVISWNTLWHWGSTVTKNRN